MPTPGAYIAVSSNESGLAPEETRHPAMKKKHRENRSHMSHVRGATECEQTATRVSDFLLGATPPADHPKTSLAFAVAGVRVP